MNTTPPSLVEKLFLKACACMYKFDNEFITPDEEISEGIIESGGHPFQYSVTYLHTVRNEVISWMSSEFQEKKEWEEINVGDILRFFGDEEDPFQRIMRDSDWQKKVMEEIELIEKEMAEDEEEKRTKRT